MNISCTRTVAHTSLYLYNVVMAGFVADRVPEVPWGTRYLYSIHLYTLAGRTGGSVINLETF